MGVAYDKSPVASGERVSKKGWLERIAVVAGVGSVGISLVACGPNGTSNSAEAPAPGPVGTSQTEAGPSATFQEAETNDSTIIGMGKFRVPNLLGDVAKFCADKMGLDPNKSYTLLDANKSPFAGEGEVFDSLAKANDYPDIQALLDDLGAKSAEFYKTNGINEPYVAKLKVSRSLCEGVKPF